MTITSLPQFNSRVIIVGDVMLDRYWSGSCKRISPEAPVPVVRVTDREDRAGGAANVAINIAALGAPCTLIGLTGCDDTGTRLEEMLQSRCIDVRFARTPAHPTITKLRVLSRNQQLIRIDFEDSAADFRGVEVPDILAREMASAAVVIFSDYGKGTLSEVRAMIELARAQGKTVLVDPKGTDFERYRGASMLTPNLSEFEAVAGPVHSEENLREKALEMIKRFDLAALLVTRSEDGMSLFRPDGSTTHLPTVAREVYDVTGAGDTVIATVGASLAAGAKLETACEIGNIAAGIVVGKLGTSTVSRDELTKAIAPRQSHAPEPHRGIVSLESLLREVARLRAEGRRIVMTNGCFDIIHRGHVDYLKRARALGDCLIVAVNTDESIARLKGPTRPVVPLQERLSVLEALGCVDYVIPFGEDTPRDLIARVLPDILVKGGDYRIEDIAGHEEVQAAGGEVLTIPLIPGCSTSAIISRIVAANRQ